MSDWIVVVNGVTLDVAHGTVPTLSLPNNGIVNFAVQVKNTNIARDNVAYGNTVVLSFQGTTMVSGFCEAPRKHRDNIIIYGKEQANELTKELILIGGTHHVEYDTTDASAILVAILALKGYTLDAVNRPGAQDISVKFYLKHILYGVEKVASILGMDWYFEGTELQMVANRGVNRGQIFNFAIRAFDEDYDAIENQIILYYTDADGARQFVTGNNMASQGLYNVIQEAYTDHEVFDAATAQLLADAIAADNGPLQTVLRLVQPIAEVIAHSLSPGDDITLADAEHGITTATSYEIRLLTYAGDRAIIEAGTKDLDKTGQALRTIQDLLAAAPGDIPVDQIPLGEQSFNTDLEFRPQAAAPDTTVEWDDSAAGNATIQFADGTVTTITLGNSGALIAGDHWAYLTIATSTVTVTTNWVNAVGPDKIVLAHLYVPTVVAGQTQHVLINPTYTRGLKVGTQTLSEGVIITPDLRTAYNVAIAGGPAGIAIFDHLVDGWGIFGYSGGVTRQFYILAADGKAYFADGTAWIDETGIHMKSDTYDFQHFYNAAAVELAYIRTSGGNTWTIRPGATNPGEMIFGRFEDGPVMILYTKAAGAEYGELRLLSDHSKPITLWPHAASYVQVVGHMHPSADSTYDLGENVIPLRWRNIFADDLYGKPHYNDLHLADLICYKCGTPFRKGDNVKFAIKGFNEDEVVGREIVTVPIHARCPIWPRVKRWMKWASYG